MKQSVCVLIVLVGVVVAARNENITTLEDLYKSHPSITRIINGNVARQSQFPWQVSVIFYKGSATSYCGGSLIHERWVLTAAHCAQGATKFVLKFGGITLDQLEPGRVEVVATRHFVHPGYDRSSLNNDIALIEMDTPVKLGGRISAIRLPTTGKRTGASEKVTVSGWGRTSDTSSSVSNILRYVDLTTIDNTECKKTYGSVTIQPSTLCCVGSNKKSTCNGDSGGPLVKIDASGTTQVGIVSFVHTSGCGVGMPSGYIRTESYLNWICQITGVVGCKSS